MNASPGASQLWRILKDKIGMLSPRHQNAEATRLAERLVDVSKRGFPADHPAIAESREILAHLYLESGREADATALFQEVYDMQIARQEAGDLSDLLRTGTTLASLLLSADRSAEAARIYEEVIPRTEDSPVDGSAQQASLHGNYAVALNRIRRDEEAEVHYLKALDLYRGTHGAEDPLLAVMHDHLGEFYLSRGRLKEAEQAYARALQIRRQNVATEPGELAQAYGNLAVVHHSASHLEEAEALYANALEILDQRGGRLSADEIVTLQNYASLLYATNRKRKAAAIEKRIARA